MSAPSHRILRRVEIRRVRADEWRLLRDVRLRALADSPSAFAATLAEEAAYPDARWQDRAAGGAAGDTRIAFVAAEHDRFAGTASGYIEADGGVDLVGMWLDPEFRRRGLGEALTEAVVAWAAARCVPEVRLWVTETNEAAMRLYKRCGFSPTETSEPLPSNPSLAMRRMVRTL